MYVLGTGDKEKAFSRHIGALFGGGIQEYCPRRRHSGVFVRRRRHSGVGWPIPTVTPSPEMKPPKDLGGDSNLRDGKEEEVVVVAPEKEGRTIRRICFTIRGLSLSSSSSSSSAQDSEYLVLTQKSED